MFLRSLHVYSCRQMDRSEHSLLGIPKNNLAKFVAHFCKLQYHKTFSGFCIEWCFCCSHLRSYHGQHNEITEARIRNSKHGFTFLQTVRFIYKLLTGTDIHKPSYNAIIDNFSSWRFA